MTKQEFDQLPEKMKLDLCRHAAFAMSIAYADGTMMELYSLPDGQWVQMHVLCSEEVGKEEEVDISLCDEQSLQRFISGVDLKDILPGGD